MIKVHTGAGGWECSSALVLWLSTPRVQFWNRLVEGEQKELRSKSKDMQASLEQLQQEVRLWQARYEGAQEDLQRMEGSLRKLHSQCEVRPGLVGSGHRACALGDSLGSARSEWVLTGVCAQRLCVNVTPRPRGSQGQLKGTNPMTGGVALETPFT